MPNEKKSISHRPTHLGKFPQSVRRQLFLWVALVVAEREF